MKFSNDESLNELLHQSQSWDGYKREKAVARLGDLGTPLAIPELIKRANDWVPQVRFAARESLEKLLLENNAEAYVLCLPDIHHLNHCWRDNHKNLISLIEAYLLKKENVSHLINGISNSSPYVARICLDICIKNRVTTAEYLLKNHLQHYDVLVRLKISKFISEFSEDIQLNYIKTAIKDKYMPIRREAFQLLLNTGNQDSLAEKFLFDRHPAIREVSIRHLERKNKNPSSIYAASLKSSIPLNIRCSLWGLAYLRKTDHIENIEKFIKSDSPSIRKHALNALISLDSNRTAGLLKICLSDNSPSVGKESLRLITKHNIRIDFNYLLSIVKSSRNTHSLNLCINASKIINKWERLIFLAKLYEIIPTGNDKHLETINSSLSEWNHDFNRSWTKPSPYQVEILQNLATHSEKNMEEAILFAIKPYLKQ